MRHVSLWPLPKFNLLNESVNTINIILDICRSLHLNNQCDHFTLSELRPSAPELLFSNLRSNTEYPGGFIIFTFLQVKVEYVPRSGPDSFFTIHHSLTAISFCHMTRNTNTALKQTRKKCGNNHNIKLGNKSFESVAKFSNIWESH